MFKNGKNARDIRQFWLVQVCRVALASSSGHFAGSFCLLPSYARRFQKWSKRSRLSPILKVSPSADPGRQLSTRAKQQIQVSKNQPRSVCLLLSGVRGSTKVSVSSRRNAHFRFRHAQANVLPPHSLFTSPSWSSDALLCIRNLVDQKQRFRAGLSQFSWALTRGCPQDMKYCVFLRKIRAKVAHMLPRTVFYDRFCGPKTHFALGAAGLARVICAASLHNFGAFPPRVGLGAPN